MHDLRCGRSTPELAAAAHACPGEPFVLRLKPPDLGLLAAAFDAGADRLETINEAQQHDIAALLARAPGNA